MNFWNSLGFNTQELDEEEQQFAEEELPRRPTAADNLARRGHEVRLLLLVIVMSHLWDSSVLP